MSQLDIPISWTTPNGLHILQYYLKSKKTNLFLSIGGNNRNIVIKEFTEKLDKRKQNQAIIPNIIHSLDANHLMSVINYSYKHLPFPIITIHDCFGTHPNNMEDLEKIVKLEFIKLYLIEDKTFLERFHDRIIQTIKDNQLKIEYKKLNNEEKLFAINTYTNKSYFYKYM